MKIDGLVVCVGEKYAEMLSKSLPIWLDTLDSVTVVRRGLRDLIVHECVKSPCNLHYVNTDLFTAHGAHFNKGAALSAAFADLNPQEWVLNFDADIIPEPDWRKKIESKLRVGNLYGAMRRLERGLHDPESTFPDLWGYFHLWHVDDPHSWIRPVYPVDCGHAGNYDHTFLKQWPVEYRRELKIKLIHQGEPRNRWFGDHPDSEKKMNQLHILGLYEAWFTKAGHIKVPEPEEIVICSRLPDFIKSELRKYTVTDPFKYRVRVENENYPCPNIPAAVSTK